MISSYYLNFTLCLKTLLSDPTFINWVLNYSLQITEKNIELKLLQWHFITKQEGKDRRCSTRFLRPKTPL